MTWSFLWVQLVVFLSVFLAGGLLTVQTLWQVFPAPNECQALRDAPLFPAPCNKLTNTTKFVDTTVGEGGGVGAASLFSAFFLGLAVTLASDAVLWRRLREPGQTFIEFVKYSALPEITQSTICLASTITFFIAFLNKEVDWQSVLLSSMSPEQTHDEFQRALKTLMCISRHPVFQTFFVAEMFALSSVTINLLLHMVPSSSFGSLERQMARLDKRSFNVRSWDVCYTMLEAWSIYIWQAVPKLRKYNLLMLSVAFRTIRFARVFDMIIAHNNLLEPTEFQPSTSDKDIITAYRRQLCALGLTLAKAVFFFWTCAILTITLEGFSCEYAVPFGVSPCACQPQMRESVVAVYFIFTTGTSVGFGDFSPKTDLGRVLIIAVMLSAVSILPGWAEQVMTIFENMSKANQELSKRRHLNKSLSKMSIFRYSKDSESISMGEFATMSREDTLQSAYTGAGAPSSDGKGGDIEIELTKKESSAPVERAEEFDLKRLTTAQRLKRLDEIAEREAEIVNILDRVEGNCRSLMALANKRKLSARNHVEASSIAKTPRATLGQFAVTRKLRPNEEETEHAGYSRLTSSKTDSEFDTTPRGTLEARDANLSNIRNVPTPRHEHAWDNFLKLITSNDPKEEPGTNAVVNEQTTNYDNGDGNIVEPQLEARELMIQARPEQDDDDFDNMSLTSLHRVSLVGSNESSAEGTLRGPQGELSELSELGENQ
eukprot:c19190_g1_i1.p1 GENE.c19190_g1_i1~~c19190_g1_i1.p1  ORF type:complete len:715 (+),score=179.13 c19190_g1_i1:45-2189(+)